MTISIDDYINRVLAALPPGTPRREQIAMELRGEYQRAGRLGPAAARRCWINLATRWLLAESYLSAVPLVAGDFWSRATARLIDFAMPVVLLSPVSALIWFATSARVRAGAAVRLPGGWRLR